jgi:hypothetical protein
MTGVGDRRRTPPLHRAHARIERRAKVGVSRRRESRRRGSPQPAHQLWTSFWAPELQQQNNQPRGVIVLPGRDERKCKKLIPLRSRIEAGWLTSLNHNILLEEHKIQQQSLRSGAGPFSSVRGAQPRAVPPPRGNWSQLTKVHCTSQTRNPALCREDTSHSWSAVDGV